MKPRDQLRGVNTEAMLPWCDSMLISRCACVGQIRRDASSTVHGLCAPMTVVVVRGRVVCALR